MASADLVAAAVEIVVYYDVEVVAVVVVLVGQTTFVDHIVVSLVSFYLSFRHLLEKLGAVGSLVVVEGLEEAVESLEVVEYLEGALTFAVAC